jgi:hypothetical protein
MDKYPGWQAGTGAAAGAGCREPRRHANDQGVAIFKARSADDLTILRAGMCPDCGASVNRTMTACRACDLAFDNNLADLPAPKGAAPATPAPPPAAVQSAPQQAQPPPSRHSAQPGAPTLSASPGYGAPPTPALATLQPSVMPNDPSARGQPLTADDIDLLERGPLRSNEHPLTDAEGPDVSSGPSAPLLGSSLARAAIVVMADAAIVDDPLVLLGYPAEPSHVARAMINLYRGDAGHVDDPEVLIAAREVATAEASPPRKSPSREAVPSVAQPTAAVGPTGGGGAGPGAGKALTLEDIDRLEHPLELEQPHSFAELVDLNGAGGDPLLGAALIRGSTVTMADAAIVDDPLVLLGYAPVIPRDVARAMINLHRGDAGHADNVDTLLVRPATHAAPQAAPPSQPGGRRTDPEATALLDQAAVRAAQVAVQEELRRQPAQQAQAQQNPNRVASVILGRGGVKSLD